MNRASTLLAFLLLSPVLGLAQQPTSPTPEDAYTSRELIAWSQLQKPQPAPQPMPPNDSVVPEPGPPKDQQPKTPADPHSQREPATAKGAERPKSVSLQAAEP
jgi:hypothetical protein